MINLLIVEDSSVMLEAMRQIIAREPAMAIVGTCTTGEAALEMVRRLSPDLVLMDIHLPGMDGFAATKQIMEQCPRPVVIVSATWDESEVSFSFRALEAGALHLCAKPLNPGSRGFEDAARHLLQMIRLLSEVHVVRRYPARSEPRPPTAQAPAWRTPGEPEFAPRLVAIGASTGGPSALRTLLGGLPASFPAPILVVQHIAEGFLRGMVEWLSGTCSLPIDIAVHGELPRAGRVYFAPTDYHLTLDSRGRLRLDQGPLESGVRPAAGRLFQSLVDGRHSRIAAALLTGMGRDGAVELKRLRVARAITFTKSPESGVVNGMPGEAVRLGGATYVLPPDSIARALVDFTQPSVIRDTDDGATATP